MTLTGRGEAVGDDLEETVTGELLHSAGHHPQTPRGTKTLAFTISHSVSVLTLNSRKIPSATRYQSLFKDFKSIGFSKLTT